MNRHFILSNGRSGSNYFVQLLNQHPEIVNYGEVLGPWTLPGQMIRPHFRGADGAARYLDWLHESGLAFWTAQVVSWSARRRKGRATHFRQRDAVATLGVKEFTVNIARYGLENYLSARHDIRLITLVRSNPLARLLSTRQLKATGQVARIEGDRRPVRPKLELAPEELIGDLEVIERENEAVRATGRTHRGPVFALEYEAFFSRSQDERDRVVADLQAFLGVAHAPIQSEHRRLRRTPLAEAIANYDQVRAVLAGGPFERWLVEPA